MVDYHIHMLMDGCSWQAARDRHKNGVDTAWVEKTLGVYREKGYRYLRDGGDRFGVCAYAKSRAESYGITYTTPLAPICKRGHYGSFIGQEYDTLEDYVNLIKDHRAQGADFIKLMISGIMDFDRFGVLSEEPFEEKEIGELIHIAHEEGFSVMAHANGARTVEAAARAGVDSVEHGAYLDAAALEAMVDTGTVWVPTLSTLGNLLGKGRFSDASVARILEGALENVESYAAMGGLLAIGTDAGAWAVPHGCGTELGYLTRAGVTPESLEYGGKILEHMFRPEA